MVLAASAPIAAAALPAEFILFRSAPLQGALEENHFYQDYPRLLLAFSAASGNLLAPGLGSWLQQNLANSAAEDALRFVFPESWIRDQSDRLIQGFYAYANFEPAPAGLALDLHPIKLRLTGGEGRMLIEQSIAAWPVCTLEDSLVAGALLLQGSGAGLPRCRPGQDLMPVYLEILQAGMNAVAANMPDQLTLLSPSPTPVGGVYAFLRWSLRLSPLALLVLPLAAAASLGWSARPFLSWSGPPLYAGGLFSLLSAGLTTHLTIWLMPLPLGVLPPLVAELYTFAGGTFLAVWRQFLMAWAAVGAGLALLGLFILITANFLERLQKGS
jgi:hypothetical protein